MLPYVYAPYATNDIYTTSSCDCAVVSITNLFAFAFARVLIQTNFFQ